MTHSRTDALYVRTSAVRVQVGARAVGGGRGGGVLYAAPRIERALPSLPQLHWAARGETGRKGGESLSQLSPGQQTLWVDGRAVGSIDLTRQVPSSDLEPETASFCP